MKSTLRISLKSGERIFVNGAVLRVDRKVAVEFLNDVTFLLENHVLQPEDAAGRTLRCSAAGRCGARMRPLLLSGP